MRVRVWARVGLRGSGAEGQGLVQKVRVRARVKGVWSSLAKFSEGQG